MADAVLKSVLGSLASPAVAELKTFLCFRRQKEKLESMFTAIKATLEDAEEKQFSDRATKDWVGKLKDAAYELDDILDEFAYEQMRLEEEEEEREVKCCVSEMVLRSSLATFHPMNLYFRYNIVRRMKIVSERLDQIASEKNQLHLTSTIQEETRGVPGWRQTLSLVTEPKVYGREEDIKAIVEFLAGAASRPENLPVYPIKTFEKKRRGNNEYHEIAIKLDYVSVAETLGGMNKKKETTCKMADAVLKSVLGSLASPAVAELKTFLCFRRQKEKLESMFTAIKATLEDAEEKQFSDRATKDWVGKLKDAAYELDDILDEFAYEQMRLEEEEEEREVKCCVSEMVLRSSLATFHPMNLYFRYNIVRRMKIVSERLDQIASEKNQLHLTSTIQEETRGVPGWRQTLSLVTEPKVYGREEDIKAIVEFLADGRLDAEDVGDDVWNELYRRSLFQDIWTDEFGKVISFKIHDLVHDLAQFVAEEVCCITDQDGAPVLFERKRIQHLSDHRWGLHTGELHQLKSLKTYIKSTTTKELSSDVLKCHSLRALDVSLSKELSSSIGDLKHLRYLNLSCGDFKSLPESVCKLLNLQILKLDYCESLQKLPDSLVRLKALQQLSLEECGSLSRLPPYIGKLNSLRSLSMYFVGEEKGCLLAELGALKLKGDFKIKHLEKVKSVNDAKGSNMSSKQLNKLFLEWREFREGELEGNDEEVLEALQPCTDTLESLSLEGYDGVRFPQWMSSPLKNLAYLKLWMCRNCIKLPVLRKLPSLKKLEIIGANYVQYLEEECYDDGVAFMALEYLLLSWLPSLIRLSREDGENQFSCLSTLKIIRCPNFSMQGLHSLKKLEMNWCPQLNVWPCLQNLTCLEDLTISILPEVKGLQHMTKLKKLTLRDLYIKSLPDCFGDLPLLRELHIVGCLMLMRLPRSLSLSRLQELRITHCNLELKQRCRKETGEDWPIIAHIPRLYV
ncbi:disease resistance protein RPM1 [Vigna unguiculata]|uniref:Disease resistance protein RPM1 n=1 Tax=Vigna unguiculata TaxID=3917 RepID=A0A4D6LPW9_VIGUN|nr:disease resistance protein RPM1 [Vigna unguiculata]